MNKPATERAFFWAIKNPPGRDLNLCRVVVVLLRFLASECAISAPLAKKKGLAIKPGLFLYGSNG